MMIELFNSYLPAMVGKPITISSTSIVSSFEYQVTQHPHKIALETSKGTITYSSLNLQANQLAHFLATQNFSTETLIGICLSSLQDNIIAMLAILKIGCAYVPLDPLSPPARLELIIHDTEMPLIITDDQYMDSLKKFPYCFNLSQATPVLYSMPNSNLMIKPHSYQLCYVIYTSGSTGTPKGVCIEHHSVVNLIHPQGSIPYTSEWRIAQFSNLAFDGCVFEIWGALLNGATLLEVPRFVALDPAQLNIFLSQHPPSFLFMTTALFEQYVRIAPYLFRHIRYLAIGGEKLQAAFVNLLLKIPNAPTIIQIYGPTETTGYVTAQKISTLYDNAATVPLGYPIQNTQLYILNEAFKPISCGETGELWIGGQGVGRSYWNQPEHSEQHFILSDHGLRLYRTGDLVTLLPSGEITFTGRYDGQIKIRGFRIELDEIKKSLLMLPYVSQCIVLAHDFPEGKCLVAYVIFKQSIDSARVKIDLQKHLPHYMIPKIIIPVNDIPLTLNGKIDIKKLKIDLKKIKVDRPLPTSQTPLLATLINIWSQVLNIPPQQISLEDSFFNVGGQSLSMMQMLFRVKQHTSQDIPLSLFLENPTLTVLHQMLTAPTAALSTVHEWLENILVEDSTLPQTISSLNSQHDNNKIAHHILLTGVTGFLGIYLLITLLRETSATIYCLIRANTIEQATERLNQTFKKYELPFLASHPNLKIVLGNIEAPKLGLAKEDYQRLLHLIDAIYHNGALVNHLYDYHRLRAANVLSTIEILKFATTAKDKQIHYISTLAAATQTIDGKFIEAGPTHLPPNQRSGYVLTKWVSETLLWKAKTRGVKIKIYRPGNITGDSVTQRCSPENNHILLVVKTTAKMLAAPSWEDSFEMTPVDILAQAIIKLSLTLGLPQEIYNLHHPHCISWKEYFALMKEQGLKLITVNPKDWLQKINALKNTPDIAALSLLHSPEASTSEMYNCQHCEWTQTQQHLKNLEIHYPADPLLLAKKQLEYLKKSGFFD